jgi:hypothetical protein
MTNDENSYIPGHRQAWRSVLGIALRELGYDDPEAEKAAWIPEREDIISQLRSVCAEFGDNDWEDTLHLGDVIEKHLAKHLYKLLSY